MKKKHILFLILFLLLGFVTSCKGDMDNISTNPKKEVRNSIIPNEYDENKNESLQVEEGDSYLIPDSYEKIDYEELQGEEYYFYLFADSFLGEFSNFLVDKSETMSELEKYVSVEPDRKDKVLQYISGIKEKDYAISKFEFLSTKDNSISFNDFMEVQVLAEFSIGKEVIEKKCLLLSIQKYYEEEDITWRLEGIENVE